MFYNDSACYYGDILIDDCLFELELKGTLLGLRQFLATGNPLKLTGNALYFTVKALSFSRFLNFWVEFLVM